MRVPAKAVLVGLAHLSEAIGTGLLSPGSLPRILQAGSKE
jgi:hypothetical protein